MESGGCGVGVGMGFWVGRQNVVKQRLQTLDCPSTDADGCGWMKTTGQRILKKNT